MKNLLKLSRKDKISELYTKAKRVTEYLNWIQETGEKITISPRKTLNIGNGLQNLNIL